MHKAQSTVLTTKLQYRTPSSLPRLITRFTNFVSSLASFRRYLPAERAQTLRGAAASNSTASGWRWSDVTQCRLTHVVKASLSSTCVARDLVEHCVSSVLTLHWSLRCKSWPPINGGTINPVGSRPGEGEVLSPEAVGPCPNNSCMSAWCTGEAMQSGTYLTFAGDWYVFVPLIKFECSQHQPL